MTSAPNHPQPSNGSKATSSFVSLFAILLFFSGCELFKPISSGNGDDGRTTTTEEQPEEQPNELDPIQSRRVYDPETNTYIIVENAPTEDMDTIQWRLISEIDAPPITEEGTDAFIPTDPNSGGNTNDNNGQVNRIEQTGTTNNGSRLLTAYNLDFVLPFLANRLRVGDATGTPEIDGNSQWALQFYSGAQMALDDLRGEQLNLNVSAQDTRANLDRVRQLQNSNGLRNAHLVIGPYLRNNVAQVAEQVRNKEQVLVSPYSAASAISTDNPNYIQVNPTLETHCRNILQHAVNTQNADQIILVSGPAQASRLNIFQEENKVLRNDPETPPLTELIVEEAQFDISPYLNARSVVFIVPIFEDESFVANFLRLVYDATRNGYTRIAVYGLPQWKNFTRIDFDYYEGCNVHISSSAFIDPLNPAVRTFRRDFYERFKTLPRDEAFVGYDVTHYFARMMNQFGTRFQFELPRNPEVLLHTEFRFEPVMVPQEGASNFEQASVDHWENMYVNILQFKNYQFKKVN